jgi:hypothetical protein
LLLAVEHDDEIVGITGIKYVELDRRDYWNLYYRCSPVT